MLNTKKPNKLPHSIKENIPKSSYPTIKEIRANAIKAIAESPPARPSKPSVKLTALLDPTRTKRMNNPYTNPSSKSICSVPTVKEVCPPFFM